MNENVDYQEFLSIKFQKYYAYKANQTLERWKDWNDSGVGCPPGVEEIKKFDGKFVSPITGKIIVKVFSSDIDDEICF